MKKALKIDKKDNVAVCLENVEKDDKIICENEIIMAKEKIPIGHKVALRDIGEGEYIIKYGEIIGVATRDIRKGEHVHIHNVKSLRLPIPESIREELIKEEEGYGV